MLQASGGLDSIASQLKREWITRKNEFRNESAVKKILEQVVEVGEAIDSRMATSSSGYREDWSLCQSTLETSPQNGFEVTFADDMLAALMGSENAELTEAKFLGNVAGSEDAGTEERVAKDGASTDVTGGIVNGDLLEVFGYRKNSAIPNNEGDREEDRDYDCIFQLILPCNGYPMFGKEGDSGSGVFKVIRLEDGTLALKWWGLLVSEFTAENGGLMVPQSEIVRQIQEARGEVYGALP